MQQLWQWTTVVTAYGGPSSDVDLHLRQTLDPGESFVGGGQGEIIDKSEMGFQDLGLGWKDVSSCMREATLFFGRETLLTSGSYPNLDTKTTTIIVESDERKEGGVHQRYSGVRSGVWGGGMRLDGPRNRIRLMNDWDLIFNKEKREKPTHLA